MFIGLGLFLLQDTAGSTAIVEYPKYLLDFGVDLDKEGNNPNTQKNHPKYQQNGKNCQISKVNSQIFGTIPVSLLADREINHNFS